MQETIPPVATTPIVAIHNLRKTFGEFVAVHDFSLEIMPGELVSLLGPSGCGKTTTLRCLAGLEYPTDGTIEIRGVPVFSKAQDIQLPPEQRGLSMVFQQYALWPHMTVWENVAFALQVRKLPTDRVRQAADAALQKVQLHERRASKISQLSGGQQQRVALARALAVQPDIILFDEPLSNLDAKLREELRLELLQLQREIGFAAIYVTHDQEEAISLSSRIVVMNRGRTEQIDTPQEIWRNPATSFVADFIGSKNSMRGTVSAIGEEGTMQIEIEQGKRVVAARGPHAAVGQPVDVYIGLSDIDIAQDGQDGVNVFRTTVRLVSFQGESTLYEVQFAGRKLTIRKAGNAQFIEGQDVTIKFSPEAVRCYQASGAATSFAP